MTARIPPTATSPSRLPAPQERLPDGALCIDLTLPSTRFGIGPLSYDPIEDALGMPLQEVLSSLLRGPVQRRHSTTGPTVNVYPLALPDGEGAIIPVGRFGELGFKNLEGILILTVPMPAAGWVQQRLASAIVEGPVQGPSSDGTATVVHFAIELKAGMRASVPLGVLGEMGVEAVG
jgi:hypothetical protein